MVDWELSNVATTKNHRRSASSASHSTNSLLRQPQDCMEESNSCSSNSEADSMSFRLQAQMRSLLKRLKELKLCSDCQQTLNSSLPEMDAHGLISQPSSSTVVKLPDSIRFPFFLKPQPAIIQQIMSYNLLSINLMFRCKIQI